MTYSDSSSLRHQTSYTPETLEPAILYCLQDRYGGSFFQTMSYEQKIVMRTALCTFISQNPVWQEDGSPIPLIDLCTESAGVDWDIECQDAGLVESIRACSYLEEADIEGLILALSSQIKEKIYSSRIEKWVVASP